MSKSSNLLHLDPIAIAQARREQRERERQESAAGEKSEAESQPSVSRQPATSSQPSEPPVGGSVSRQPATSSQPDVGSQLNTSQPATSLLNSIPDVAGHTAVPHRYTDHLCRWLSPDEQAVYTQLYRLSWGWGNETCFVSNPRLSERSNVPLSTLKRVVVKLISKGLIEKTNRVFGSTREQGVEYRVLALSSQLIAGSQPTMSRQPAMSTNKEKDYKETNKSEFCTKCKDTGGFIYPNPKEPGKGVMKCKH